MPRPFDPSGSGSASQQQQQQHDDTDSQTSNRSTARVLAAALAALLVSFLVIDRSAAAFKATSENAGNTFTPGRVTLNDDDEGAPLFELPALVPGEVVENCITLTYEGTVYPATVRLSGGGTGPLAPSLRMKVDAGVGGRFDDCTGFVGTTALFDGTLDGFLERHPAERGLDVFRPVEGGATRTFRFSFGLPEDFTDQGAASTASFRWEVTTG